MIGTAIEWATHTCSSGLAMPLLTALPAEGEAVGHLKSKLGAVREGLEVVRVEVAAAIIATILALEPISCEDIEAPPFVFPGESKAAPLDRLPVLVGMVSWAFNRGSALALGGTHFLPALQRMLASLHRALAALLGIAQPSLRFFGMMAPFEGGDTALGGSRDSNATTELAFRTEPITTGSVMGELLLPPPDSATRAPLLSCLQTRQIVRKREPNPSSSRPFRSLPASHDSNITGILCPLNREA